jgi:hypothetical protein
LRSSTGSGVRILNRPAPRTFAGSLKDADQNLDARDGFINAVAD